MNKAVIILVIGLSLFGCAKWVLEPMPMNDTVRNFQYDYNVVGVDKKDLFTRGRNHITSLFGDSKSVFRVTDKEEGMIIGKGLVSWIFAPPGLVVITCHTNFELRFKAKNERVRLQLELLRGIPSLSDCKRLPSKDGYQEITRKFTIISEGIKKALQQKSSLDDF